MSAAVLKKRPLAGSATARVWEIADDLLRKKGGIPTGREVVDLYVAEGGNQGTGFTQYSHWKKAHLNHFKRAAEGGAAGSTEEAVRSLGPVTLNVAPDGRVVIPAEFRAAMQLDGKGSVTATLKDGELRLLSPRAAIRKAQEMLKPYKNPGESIVDEFLSERRAMWGEE